MSQAKARMINNLATAPAMEPSTPSEPLMALHCHCHCCCCYYVVVVIVVAGVVVGGCFVAGVVVGGCFVVGAVVTSLLLLCPPGLCTSG